MEKEMFSLREANSQIKRKLISKFPVEILPDFIQEAILELYENSSFNMDYISGAALSALASSIGNKFHVRKDITWSENPSLWIVMVGRNGQNKSAPQKVAYKAITNKQSELNREYEEAMNSYDPGLGDPKPLKKKLYSTEPTFESLLKMHKDNPHGITIKPDEFKTFVDGLVGYNGSSRRSSYLSLWDGAPISSDRKDAESASIDKPCINIVGGIQDDVIASLKSKDTKDGFFERMLFVVPLKMEKRFVSETPVNEHTISVYISKMHDFLENMLGRHNYEEIGLSPEASRLFDQERNSHVEPSNKDSNVSGILSKLDRYMLRFALILEVTHCFFNSKPVKDISEDSMKRAIMLKNYFFENALKINDIMEKSYESNTPNGKVYAILKAIGKETFSSREFIEKAKQIHSIGKSRSYELLSIGKLTQELGKGQYRSKVYGD
ncbi:DUF3987 domain-containing protein [Carboxylicivirga linearis]|uniref:DUF3987 domain-containing protein n=1 Tax=Carboxylicivirga linearis TaxID=1628157 RepID=A0ABS5K150_9BACT|nr:DUF3987 domain-containing protein [Carboxylicivirga linearis]MBS2100838.1 DUF3987 domain-containing protein [Carboxylicivirga linearis]